MTAFVLVITLMSGPNIVLPQPTEDDCWSAAVLEETKHKGDVRTVECIKLK